jgi:hypothetical protein
MEEDMGEESMRRREEGEEGEYAGGIWHGIGFSKFSEYNNKI